MTALNEMDTAMLLGTMATEMMNTLTHADSAVLASLVTVAAPGKAKRDCLPPCEVDPSKLRAILVGT